jgi:hypothetical protein
MGWLGVVAVLVLVGLIAYWRIRISRSYGEKPEDLRRADDEPPSKPSMLGRYWPGPW